MQLVDQNFRSSCALFRWYTVWQALGHSFSICCFSLAAVFSNKEFSLVPPAIFLSSETTRLVTTNQHLYPQRPKLEGTLGDGLEGTVAQHWTQ